MTLIGNMMRRALAGLVVVLITQLLPRTGSAQCYTAELLPPAEYDLFGFGHSVDLDGDVLALTAGFEDLRKLVFIYRRQGDAWLLEDVWAIPGTLPSVVKVHGNRIAVSSSFWEGSEIHVLRYVDGAWTLEGEIGDQVGEPHVAFDIYGDTLVVAYYTDGAGIVYVYQYVGSQWLLQQALTSPHGDDEDFGAEVALWNTGLLVGSWYRYCNICDPHTRVGTMYAFRHDGASWNLEQQLCASDGSCNWYARTIGLRDDVAAVSADLWDGSGYYEIHRYSAGNWPLQNLINNVAGSRDNIFVAVDSESVVLGGRSADWSMPLASVFRHSGGGAWALVDEFAVPLGGEEPARVAASGGLLAVGLPWADSAGTDRGAVRVYSLNAKYVDGANNRPGNGACMDPYSSVQQGVANVADGQALIIASGIYSVGPSFTISRPMRLVASGGFVHIGQ